MWLVVQVLGFFAALALLAWCVHLAFHPDRPEGAPDPIAQVLSAPPASLLGLLALGAASILINGAIFWATLRPVRRLSLRDVQATNALATFLAYLPFKLSLVVRVVIHSRRDRVPLLTIGAWFGAVAVVLVATLGPVGLVSMSRAKLDAWWWGATAGLLVAVIAAVVCSARVLAGVHGRARLAALAVRVVTLPARVWRAGGGTASGSDEPSGAVRRIHRIVHSRLFAEIHVGSDMLADPRAVAATMLLRLADLLVQAGRFALAAGILDRPIRFDAAILLAATYYLAGVVSPVGMIGTREGATIGVAGLTLAETASRLAPVALLVSAADAMVSSVAAGLALVWLRPDRLLRVSAPPAPVEADPPVES